MTEKDMVNDVLSQVGSSLANYANVIAQSETPEFRKTIQDLRNNCETFQYNLFQMAQQKGYYQPAAPAQATDIQTVKGQFMA